MSVQPGCDRGLRRSLRLFQAFRQEQTDPDFFYRTLAADSVAQVSRWVRLDGARVLDVGGGPGYFAQAFADAGARYVLVETDLGEGAAASEATPAVVQGSGCALPFVDGCVDLCYSSNVLEHVAEPAAMLAEMVRVTRPGGVVVVGYTTWWGPWGGHETAPWHLFGGARARARYVRVHGREPKNRFGESLFALTVRQGRRLAAATPGADLVSVFPRYLPDWAAGLPRIPVLGELLTWNLMIVLRRVGGRP